MTTVAGSESGSGSGSGAADRPDDFVGGNVYDKYRTKNPLYRRLMQGFLDAASDLLTEAPAERVLEVGCGPGDLAGQLRDRVDWFRGASYRGLDLSLDDVAEARASFGPRFLGGSAYRLPFADASFDGLMACEVFEHLERPGEALDEVARVTSGWLLLSVPWEPVWRLLNVARGQYLGRLGNTPGHVQNFSRRQIRELVSRRFDVVAERRPFPWTMLLARLR